VPLSCNLGILTSWNPLGHSSPVKGLLDLAKDTILTISDEHKFVNCNLIMFLISSTLHEDRYNAEAIDWMTDKLFSIPTGCQIFLSSQNIPDLLFPPGARYSYRLKTFQICRGDD
jgi:hypothetical protein